jgi:hypothetical protein
MIIAYKTPEEKDNFWRFRLAREESFKVKL